MEPVNPIRLSYAQNYEDVLLWRALGHIKEGCYLDIGACDPIADSVSKAFYLAGWRGVHVDPSVTCADALRKDRPDEIVIQAVVADEPGFVTFYEFPDTGLSTCVEEFADRHRAAGHVCEVSTAPVIALAELLDLAAGPDLHWLKIDVEGFERKVLSSWGQSFVRPWVLVIESTEPNSQIQTQCEWLDLVHELGYHEVTFDGLSRFFVSDAHCELDAAFIANPNIFDSFNVTERHFSSRALVGEWRTERDRLIAAMTNCEAQAAVDRDAFEQLLTAAHEQVEAGHAAAYALQKELQEAAMRAESLALDNASLTLERGDLERAMQDRAIEVAQFEVSEQLLRSQYEISQALVIALQDDLAAERRAGEERMAEFHHELSERNRSLQGAKKIISEAAEFLTSSIILAIRPSARRHLRAMRHELDEWPSLNLPYLTAEYQSDSYTTLSHNTEPRDINMSIFDVDMRDPYHRAESLANLCAFADLDFVRCAFVTILGRQPDPEGEAYYLARLRSGVAKLSILRQLRNSQEGRNHDPGIAGLDRALRRHRNASRPFFGLLIRWVTRREGDSIVQRPLRALENQQALEARRAALRFLHINHLLHELDGSIDSLHHNVQQLQLRGGSSSINISQKIAADSSDWRSSLTAAIKS